VQPGDLVFFEGTAGANAGERISHVGIVTENGMMLNAPQPGSNVQVASYMSPYWAPKIVGYGRLP
jgi:cell wall-associated NlpC family hydrolase